MPGGDLDFKKCQPTESTMHKRIWYLAADVLQVPSDILEIIHEQETSQNAFENEGGGGGSMQRETGEI